MAKKYQLTQDGPEVQALLNKVEGLKANQTPGAGETPTALETLSLEGVLYSVVTKAVSDLVNYYTKSETYTKAEVGQMLSALSNGAFVSVAELPVASAETFGLKIYLVPSANPAVENLKDEYITTRSGEEGSYTYAWEQIGSTAVDLSGYVTTDALNTALANYVTSDALATALAGLNDVKYTVQSLTDAQKAQARTNIGATAPEVFWAVYGETTFEEVRDAIASGKEIAVAGNNTIVLFSGKVGDNYYFASPNGTQSFRYYILTPQDAWSGGTVTLEQSTRKVSTIVGHEAETDKYPNTKAVADAIEAGKQVFWAEYGVTTLNEITTAYNSGKAVLCIRQGALYVISKLETTFCYFTCVNVTSSLYLLLNGQTSWSTGIRVLQTTASMSQDIETDQASTTKYPSVKAVADALPVAMTDAQLDTLFDANWQ